MPIIGRKAEFRQPSANKPIIGVKTSKPSKPPKPPKPKKPTFREELERIKGIGKKTAGEIIEEHKTKKSLVHAIQTGKFSVGGVDRKKQELILKKFK